MAANKMRISPLENMAIHALFEQGETQRNISTIANRHIDTIKRQLKIPCNNSLRVASAQEAKKEIVDTFRDEIIALTQDKVRMCLKYMTPEKVEKAGLPVLSTMYGIMIDKLQILSGKHQAGNNQLVQLAITINH